MKQTISEVINIKADYLRRLKKLANSKPDSSRKIKKMQINSIHVKGKLQQTIQKYK